MSTTEEGFFADIRESPGDDVPRLVYADWLEENGDEVDSVRAEFIRVQVRLARLVENDPDRDDLTRRELYLRDRLEKTWLAPLRLLADSVELRRGFVERVVVGAAQFIKDGQVILRLAPVAELAVFFLPAELPTLVECPTLKHVHRLEARGAELGDAGAHLLGTCPHLGGLQALLLHSCAITATGLEEILALDLSRLRALNLGLNDLRDQGMERLCASVMLARLELLSLGANTLHLPSARALAHATHLRHLTDINLGANYLDDESMEVLAGASHLASLRRLDVRNNEFGVAGARALARSAHFGGLAFLDVSGNRIGSEGLAVLSARFGDRVRT